MYVGNGVSSSISGKETVIGSDVDPGTSDVQAGNGIWVTGSTPRIENVSVKYNRLDGIRVERASHTIKTTELEEYTATRYDHRLTYDQGTNVEPHVEASGSTVYVAYWLNESNSIYLKRSDDYGGTWSEPILVTSPSEEIDRIDFAADGDYLAFIWEEKYNTTFHIVYSSDGGDTWQSDSNGYEGYRTSIEVSGSNLYVCAVKFYRKV